MTRCCYMCASTDLDDGECGEVVCGNCGFVHNCAENVYGYVGWVSGRSRSPPPSEMEAAA